MIRIHGIQNLIAFFRVYLISAHMEVTLEAVIKHKFPLNS
jgi:hypothetical protein